jgi:hypothetical protein
MDELIQKVEAAGASYARGALRAMEEGVWRRTTDTTEFGLTALSVKARGYHCARALGLAEYYEAVRQLGAIVGEAKLKALLCELNMTGKIEKGVTR